MKTLVLHIHRSHNKNKLEEIVDYLIETLNVFKAEYKLSTNTLLEDHKLLITVENTTDEEDILAIGCAIGMLLSPEYAKFLTKS